MKEDAGFDHLKSEGLRSFKPFKFMSGIQNSGLGRLAQNIPVYAGAAAGKVKDFFVAVGEGICKAGNAVGKFFGSIGTALSSRAAQLVEPRATPRAGGSEATSEKEDAQKMADERKELVNNATLAELRAGQLDVDADAGIEKSANFLKEFSEACKDSKGNLRPEHEGREMEEFEILLDAQLAKGVDGGTILRSNTADTAYQAAFFRAVGGDYVADVLSETVSDIRSGGKALEMDPNRIASNHKAEHGNDAPELSSEEIADIIQNSVDNLAQHYDKLMDNIGSSAMEVPQKICDAARLVYDKVKDAGGSEHTATCAASGTIVLRLLNPSLMSPQIAPKEGSLGGAQAPDGQRTALMLSKILQNQANLLTSFSKEVYMEPLAGCLTKHADSYNAFLGQVLERGKSGV